MTACQQTPTAADFSDYQLWIAKPGSKAKADKLLRYLRAQGVDQVIPLHQLLRSDVKWKQCGVEPFDVPPTNLWPNMVPTLRVIRDEVVPQVGPVEALSVFRSPEINTCIKGAKLSYHLRFFAIDMKPVKKAERYQLISKLCRLYHKKGQTLGLGLGIYGGTRFHIDTAAYRSWGGDHHAATSPCRLAR